MLPKPARIRKDRDFKAMFARGRSYRGDLIVVYMLLRQDKAVRFGFTTVKKIGKAVERNRLKRLLREAAREMLPDVTQGMDILVLARARAAGASLDELREEMARLLGRSGALATGRKE